MELNFRICVMNNNKYKLESDGFISVYSSDEPDVKEVLGYRCSLCKKEFEKGFDHQLSCENVDCPMDSVDLDMA